MKSLSYPFNSVYMKLFKTFNANTIKQVQYYCGYLPLSYVLDLRKLNFYYDLCYVDSSPASVLFRWLGWEEIVKIQQHYSIPAGPPKGNVKKFFFEKFMQECVELN